MKQTGKTAKAPGRKDLHRATEVQRRGDLTKPNDDAEIEPTLLAYFTATTAMPSAFLKSVVSAGIERFEDADEVQALEHMAQGDATGERLWALASSARLPVPVDRWLWRAIQERLSGILGPAVDLRDSDATRILNATCEMLRRKANSLDEGERKAARNWLRLAVLWLMEFRSLKARDAAEALQPVLLGDRAKIESVATRSISNGSSSTFDAALAGTALALDQAREARSRRDEKAREVADLQGRLKDAKVMVDRLGMEKAELADELAVLKEQLASAELQNQQQRQHWGHDLTESEARQKSLLERELSPLINDAIDALEIGRPEIAQERLTDVRAALLKASSQ